jgi:hypothetical protein
MWELLGSLVDVVHALLMAAWVLGLPFLFVHRWPTITRAYGIYAISFIFVSQVSHLVLGECFLTTVASSFWQRSAASTIESAEWFTVRLSKWIFDRSPSHRAIVIASEVLIFLTAFGELVALRLSRGLGIRALARAPRARRDKSDR